MGIGTIARRTFLIGSIAVTGGVAFGYYAFRKPQDNPLDQALGEGEAALTPYVKIDTGGVTLITPRADKGQGAYHVQAALIAEELDVDLADITVDPGPPSPVYFNAALAHEAVPFPSYDTSFAAERMRKIAEAPVKFMGMQITGGSSTVPDAFEKLRMAGAAARETLKAVAAKAANVSADELRTENGAVILPDGTRVPYMQLAAAAANVTPRNPGALRDPKDWRYLGKEMQRLDIVDKSTGRQAYGIDLAFDGMVYAAVRRNPRQGGGLRGYDAAEAEAMRGIQTVMPVEGGVAVVADNTWRAMKAAEAINCDWDEGPERPLDMDGHWQALADSFNDEQLNNVGRDDGAAADVLTGEDISAEYRAPYLAHAPLEPMNAIVLVRDARVDVWTGTQVPQFVQRNVAAVTGHAPEDVHVHVQMMGGSFGHRLEDDYVRQTAQIANKLRGTPVKMTYSREEDFLHDYVRQISLGRMRGRTENGQVDAVDMSVAMPSISASQFGRQGMSLPGPDPIITTGLSDQPYVIPHYRVRGYASQPLAPVSSWRSVGASTNGFFHEGFLDELIHAAGADPLAERIRLIEHDLSRKALEAVGEMSGWGRELGPDKGLGVAFSLSFGVPVAEVVEVTNTPEGIRIDKVWVAAEVGRVLDPVNFDNLVKGGVVFGLGHAMNCEVTYENGAAAQTNYHAYPGMRLYQCPQIEVRGLENGPKIKGIGEPPVPPAAPALANAIFAATGQRLREMPFSKFVDFV